MESQKQMETQEETRLLWVPLGLLCGFEGASGSLLAQSLSSGKPGGQQEGGCEGTSAAPLSEAPHSCSLRLGDGG